MTADQERTTRDQQPALSADPAQLEREIEARREHLAATVDELLVRTHPKELARRGAADATQRVRRATTTPDGRLRVERVGAVAAALLAVVTLLVLRSRRRRRG